MEMRDEPAFGACRGSCGLLSPRYRPYICHGSRILIDACGHENDHGESARSCFKDHGQVWFSVLQALAPSSQLHLVFL